MTTVENSHALSNIEAFGHLVRGNFGAGCLSLPYFMSLTGPVNGSLLLGVVCFHGTYMCWILSLVYVRLRKFRTHLTYMEMVALTLGPTANFLIHVCVFITQFGVVAVFISLVSENLHSFFPSISNLQATLLLSPLWLLLALIRTIQGMNYLTLFGNICMVTALISCAAYSFETLPGNNNNFTNNPSHMFLTLSSYFYSFEGICVIIPVANETKNWRQFPTIALLSYSSITSFFFLMALPACLAFGTDIQTGSIIAYFVEEHRHPWFVVVNALVTTGIVCSFSLQLFPTVEVIESWRWSFQAGGNQIVSQVEQVNAKESSESSDKDNCTGERTEQRLIQVSDDEPAEFRAEERSMLSTLFFPRMPIVVVAILINIVITQLQDLLALSGACGQTAATIFPALMHLKLMYFGDMPRNLVLAILDVIGIIFATTVMCGGIYFSLVKIIDDFHKF